jgi:hypothetical protein
MAAIPVPGSELRHVRKTVTFTGAANNGALGDFVTVFTLTGSVLIPYIVGRVTTGLVCSAGANTLLRVRVGSWDWNQYEYVNTLATIGQFLGNGSSTTEAMDISTGGNGLGVVAGTDVGFYVQDGGAGANITGGTIVVDCWYHPVTDDGALAGEDIDSQLVDAIWDEAQSGHTTAGTFGRYLDSQLATIASYIDTEIAAIKAKTDSLTFTVAGIVDSNVVDWKGSAAPANTGDAFARLGAPAGASVSADIATVATYVDTEVAAIKAVTDNLPNSGALSTIQSDLNDLQTRLPAALVGGRMDSSVGAMAAAVITAAAIATDAIDADALAADAVTEIWAKAMSELASVPAVNGTVLQALEWIFLLARNKITQTATTQTLRNDADNANLSTSTVSDDGTTFTRGEWS